MRALLFAVPLLLACSSSSNGGDAPSDSGTDSGNTTDPLASCARFADAYCPRFDTCAGFFVEYSFGDVETCKKRLALACKFWVTSPGTSGDTAFLDSCIASLPSLSCPALINGEACGRPTGSIEVGGSCGDASQCKSGFCANIDAAGCGKCAAQPTPGSACVGGQCGDTLRCSPDALCIKPGKLGDACKAASECSLPLSCVGSKCVAPAALGGACATDGKAPDCDFTIGNLCVAGKCTTIGISGTGGTCGGSASGITVCKGGGKCQTGSGPMGTCRPPTGDGEPCDESAGVLCTTPSKCLGGVCKLPDPGACK